MQKVGRDRLLRAHHYFVVHFVLSIQLTLSHSQHRPSAQRDRGEGFAEGAGWTETLSSHLGTRSQKDENAELSFTTPPSAYFTVCE